ncbi:hypothetical protein ANO11243_023940 [Dothideomycetidae sp. 11243]|nr:hypothetical protein ANO11243_023940 [fungal sp. No.11243]
MPSHLRTYVQWRDHSVFAGEDIECVITFKNVARTPQQRDRDAAQPRPRSRLDPLQPILERQRNTTLSTTFTKTTLARLPSVASASTAPQRPGHRATLSLGVEPSTPPTDHAFIQRRPKAHGRSLSILSIGTGNGSPAGSRNSPASPGRPGCHARSASLQMTPRGSAYGSPRMVGFSNPNSPALRQDANGAAFGGLRSQQPRSTPNTAPTTPALPQGERSRSGTMTAEYRFPREEPGRSGPEYTPPTAQTAPVRSRKPSQVLTPEMPERPSGLGIASINSMSRVLSDPSANGTSRTSSDIYTMSNVSEETINSEFPSQPSNNNLMSRPPLSRQSSQRKNPRKADQPEHLMMGYVQTKGSFSVDGSLVNQGPFEEVKRRGVVSSQAGGGVVGVERSKRQSGLLGAFGWSNIGESLTGLLGMDEMSSMREMKNAASMKNVPLLSTPQSILFVDLRLAPGESRSYTYRFKIPKGLPPTHKGRAIKVAYHLRIAVQRSGSAESRNITDVEIPFRILGSVNRDGEILGHDLMSPYILLQDTARTASLSKSQDAAQYFPAIERRKNSETSDGTMDDFLQYTQQLMEERPAGAPLISPTAITHNRRFSTDLPQARTMKERIDLAILRSNQTLGPHNDVSAPSTNRFTIARSGQHVGVLTIVRPAFRLGETVHVKIDFHPPESTPLDQHTYLVTISLESLEKIDSSLALRGPASVLRATRKAHAAVTRTVFFARQVGVGLEIPTAATPSFDTSGVQLQWRIRVEFTTSVLQDPSEDMFLAADGLLEPFSTDDRGQILVARERLAADSWEVNVPIRVFGQADGLSAAAHGAEGVSVGGYSEVFEI